MNYSYSQYETQMLDKIASLINSKKFDQAKQKLLKLEKKYPKNSEIPRLLGVISLKQNKEPLAEKYLLKSFNLNQKSVPVILNLASLYKQQKRYSKAHELFKTIILEYPDNEIVQYNLGNLYRDEERWDEAENCYLNAIKTSPTHVGSLTTLGFICKNKGDINKSIEYFHHALAIQPFQPEIYWALANLKTYKFSESEKDIITSMLDGRFKNNIELLFTKAHYLEHDKKYSEAYEFLKQANTQKYQSLNRIAFDWKGYGERIKNVFTPEFCKKNQSELITDITPVFIVGMPRSGSTLIEQILSSHSQISGASELNYIPELVKKFGKQNYPESFKDFNKSQFHQIGESYLENTKEHHANYRIFTDKQPLNFSFVGAILLSNPYAKVVHSVRNKYDVILSCYRQLFTQKHNYSYNLEELLLNYTYQENIMEYWKSLFPTRIITIEYERVLTNLKDEIVSVLSVLSLEWEDVCQKFHETKRKIKTASAAQVKEKIYTKSFKKYENYNCFIEEIDNLSN